MPKKLLLMTLKLKHSAAGKQIGRRLLLFVGLCLSLLNSGQVFAATLTTEKSMNATESSDKEPIFIAQGPPSDFGDLAKPQKAVVDVYFGDRFISTHMAMITPESIKITSPESLVTMIGNINDKQIVTQALSGDLDRHDELVCTDRSDASCRILNPLVAGVVFDESKFRLDVFINRNFLSVRETNVTKYLGRSDGKELSFMQDFSGTWSGASGSAANNENNNDFTFSGLSQLSWRENSLHLNWDYSETENMNVNDAYFNRDFQGNEYRAGILSTEGMGLSFALDRTILGGRIATSDNTRTDRQLSYGMPLVVFMPTRGVLEVRRDNRLIASFMLEAGSQKINTSSFPGGAYNIELRAVDETGREMSKENRFFTKSTQLPPPGEWVYFLEGGKVLNRTSGDAIPSATDQMLARGGLNKRITDDLSATLALATDRDDVLAEFGLFKISEGYQFTPSVMIGDSGALGVNADLQLYFSRGITSYINYRQLESNKNYDEVYDDENPTLLGGSFKQGNVGASMPLYKGTLSYNYNYVDNKNGSESQNTQSINYHTNLMRTSDYDIDTGLSYSTSRDRNIAQVDFEFRLRQDRWTFRAKPKSEYISDRSTRTNNEVLLAANWDSGDLMDTEVIADISATQGNVEDRYEGRLQLENSWGRSDLMVNNYRLDNESYTSYVANFNTNFLANASTFAVGGSEMDDSAIVLNVEGRDGDVFDVNINGAKYGYAVAGRPSVVTLSPYEKYDIDLIPSEGELYHLKAKTKTVTLYPGNVVAMKYDMDPEKILIGRLLNNGKVMSNAKIMGGYYPTETNEFGIFQLEVNADLETLFIETEDSKICRLGLIPDSEKHIQRVGNLDLAEKGICVSPNEMTEEMKAVVKADKIWS